MQWSWTRCYSSGASAWNLPFRAAVLRESSSCLFATACVFDHLREPTGKFMNALLLSELNRLFGDQFRADANRRGASKNEIESRLLVHAAGCDQRQIRERRF